MFLTEKDLKDTFWKNYNYRNRAKKYQFEAPMRTGDVDLMTLETYQDNYQINAFEFKLNDIKKVILQAEGNKVFSNKSWIVVPSEKEQIINDRYMPEIKDAGIGVIVVEEGGRWRMIAKPFFRNNIILTQELMNFICRGF